ncbi:MAG: aminoacyl-tRNA hydrolase [Gammaproteobacteria bacterium]|nr:aminoacyl-tRNA hydrolase [Gammaproteobacteria bacterium]MCZ6855431.1 aminoacyl-tRNA hydrolase [Gammaproteobacteria bacterium]
MSRIRLIVGLGNPGPRYVRTRHNVGANFVCALAERFGIRLNEESRFKGHVGRGAVTDVDVRLLVPGTFMNLSGESVGAMARFYKFEPEEILVAYDEMAFEPGVLRLKSGGGDNGHNGIKSVTEGLGNDREFHRLRIGVGHPGSPELVTAFLTSHTMPESERLLVESSLVIESQVLTNMLSGEMQKAMNELHTPLLDEEEEE